MKKIFFPLVAFLLITIASCKKDSGSDPSGGGLQLKTYTETFNSAWGNQKVVFNVSYDNEGRITNLNSTSGYKIMFSYKPSEYTMDIYALGQIQIHETFFIINGLIDSTLQTDGEGSVTSEKYIYNDKKQLVQLYQYSLDGTPYLESVTTTTYDANGNAVKTVESDGTVTTYEYYADKVNNVPDIIPAPYKNTNLVKRSTVDYGFNDVTTVDFTYTFDSKQRISTISQVSSDGESGVQQFTYR